MQRNGTEWRWHFVIHRHRFLFFPSNPSSLSVCFASFYLFFFIFYTVYFFAELPVFISRGKQQPACRLLQCILWPFSIIDECTASSHLFFHSTCSLQIPDGGILQLYCPCLGLLFIYRALVPKMRLCFCLLFFFFFLFDAKSAALTLIQWINLRSPSHK